MTLQAALPPHFRLGMAQQQMMFSADTDDSIRGGSSPQSSPPQGDHTAAQLLDAAAAEAPPPTQNRLNYPSIASMHNDWYGTLPVALYHSLLSVAGLCAIHILY